MQYLQFWSLIFNKTMPLVYIIIILRYSEKLDYTDMFLDVPKSAREKLREMIRLKRSKSRVSAATDTSPELPFVGQTALQITPVNNRQALPACGQSRDHTGKDGSRSGWVVRGL